MTKDLRQMFREALDAHKDWSSVDDITRRRCSSDRYDGTEYKFYGANVCIQPIIDAVRDTPDVAIDQMSHVNDGPACLVVFVADRPEFGPAWV